MLSLLNIKNIALIENLSITLGKGLNILSGETGAGKSIIIDSLNFVLGERADKTLIRFGAESATVEAVFEDYLNDKIKVQLDELDISAEDCLIIKRSMSISGKNECRINGHPCTLNMLKGLTELIADIHGQHEHQSLLRTSTHITLLDNYGGNSILKLQSDCKTAFNLYKESVAEYKKYGNTEERARKIDVLSYQIDELEKADIHEGEEDELISERRKFRNIEKIVNAVTDCIELLSGSVDSFSALSAIGKSKNMLMSVSDFDKNYLEMADRLDVAKIEIQDISETLETQLSDLQFDDFTAEKVEKRIELVRSLARKYGGTITSALDFLSNAKAEYTMLSSAEETCAKLENLIKKQGENLVNASKSLHKQRETLAKSFENEINTQLAELGMSGSKFKVSFVFENDITPKCCTENGYDVIEFLISANIGEPLKPLAKIISGGEMSRFMLALKNIIAKLDNIGTMVFDEIDSGISGNIAQIVAEKLYNISHSRQVIAVTHLPQLASMADLHYKIEKVVEGDKTNTHLTLLDENGEINEIARLIGGSAYSTHAIPHAMVMKKHSNEYKLKF
ncbi:MAG: DNA repair protein RecN [Clostridia bacterium]